jgi:hypothetical protein
MARERSGMAATFLTELGRSRVLKIGVLVFLWSLYPVVFTLSRNWFTITVQQIWFLLFLVPTVGIAAYSVCCVVFIPIQRLWLRFGSMASGGVDPIAASATSIIVAINYFLLHATLLSVLGREIWVLSILASFGAIYYLLLIAKSALPVFLLSVGMVLVSGTEWSYNYFVAGGGIAEVSTIARESGLDKGGKGLALADTPNIYLIIYDGYGNKDALKTIYDVDNSDSYEFLRTKGFVVNENAFSNYQVTWPMLIGLFLSNHHYYGINFGPSDTKVGRLIMNGTAMNPVYSVLKGNGYKIQSINRGHYFGGEKVNIDFYFPSSNILNGFEVFNSRYLDFLQVSLGNKAERWRRQRAMLDERIAFAAVDESPWFTMAYIYKPGHAHQERHWTELDGYEVQYRSQLEDANRHMRHIVERIQSQDPNAFVMLLGDHGGWRYVQAWNAENRDDPNEAFEVNAVPAETVTLDIFGILMAIETGGRCDEYVYDALSPVNLMRGDRFGREFSTFLTGESGLALDRWIPLTERMKTHGTEALP